MFYVSEPTRSAPVEYKTELQELVYNTLGKLNIPFERVDTDEAISMEDCILINKKLNMNTVKTLFLCNRQQTEFYLFITTADKPFNTKEFSGALGISRVSFASGDLLQRKLGVKIGAATVFGVLLDRDNTVQVVFDKSVLADPWYGCSDGTTTGYMKLETEKVFHEFLAFAKHIPKIIEI